MLQSGDWCMLRVLTWFLRTNWVRRVPLVEPISPPVPDWPLRAVVPTSGLRRSFASFVLPSKCLLFVFSSRNIGNAWGLWMTSGACNEYCLRVTQSRLLQLLRAIKKLMRKRYPNSRNGNLNNHDMLTISRQNWTSHSTFEAVACGVYYWITMLYSKKFPTI